MASNMNGNAGGAISSKTTNGKGEDPEWDLTKPLPKLPVPPLQSTLDKYLGVMKPVLTPIQFAKTKYLVDDFRKPGGQGEMLQECLIQAYHNKENWAYDWWLDDMYLKIRLALPINSNPGMVFPRNKFHNPREQLRYASRLICGILDYKIKVDRRALPIERARHKEKGQPMCMEQHYRIFTSYRAPGLKKDTQITDTGDGQDKVIVICKNQLFVMEVATETGNLSEAEIYGQLELIARLADADSANAPPVGILTSQTRDKWAASRNRLLLDPINRDSLDAIENSIFILCLDKPTCPSPDTLKIDITCLALHMLHGQGSWANTANRWFDKTMQFVVSEDGTSGLNYEHSVAEGIAVVQLVEHAIKYIEDAKLRQRSFSQSSIRNTLVPRKLCWNITSETVKDIQQASEYIDGLIDDLDLTIVRFDNFGRDFPKSQGMSPDSFIQLALQLTYYKVHSRLVSTYESASTRRFRLGRVDNIRANSQAALEWSKAMIGELDCSDEEKFAMLQEALKCQANYMTDTILGQGIDCHLLGLRECGIEACIPMPDFFKDEGFRLANHFTMSTSQVPTSMDSFMCYGPVVQDGYGVCYNPHPDYILVTVSSFNSNDDSDSAFFAMSLESSLLQMKELCLKAKQFNSVPPS
ncbi:choline O-acetyltransferase-like isoform X1 [Haliotis asinina]|uniref:choline O-acetyltransferase-like isoform X1 n=1 Tax=Haliotis asinina TaxID=109174 RepID=UPI0035327B3A